MATNIFTKRIAAADVAGAQTVVLYTAPAGQVTIIRDLVVYVNTVATARTVLRINSGTGAFYYLYLLSPAIETLAHVDVRQELLPGEHLELVATATSTRVLVTGYVFDS